MRQVKRYTKEFKQEAVKLALQKPNVTEAANDLGIPAPTLYSWIYALKDKQSILSTNQEKSVDIAGLLEENHRLHKENVVLKEEKEILKKAAADSIRQCNKQPKSIKW
jgi:transposase